MARALNQDHLQVFAFSLYDVSGGGEFGEGDAFDFGGGESGGVGFAAVTGLTITMEPEQFYEGNWPFQRSIPKHATCSEVTLRRGMLPRDSDFYNWFHAALFGFVNVRKTLMLTMNRRDRRPAKAWLLHECIPTRVMVWPDLDAMSPEIAVAELGVQPNYIEELSLAQNNE